MTARLPVVLASGEALRAQMRAWRKAGETTALVPTMGALHAGHLALVEAAQREARHVVVSIFVNPTQFGPREDLARYPRDLARDLEALAPTGCALAFAPDVAEIYPPGETTRVTVGGLSEGLCGALRPHFFGGVATVVAKLLNFAEADVALFGEKDYQQLLVIRRLARDLGSPTRIIAVPTVREADGLALSSRNAYLASAERRIAPALFQTLSGLAARARAGLPSALLIAEGIDALREAGFTRIDYLALCDAETLVPLARADRPARLLAAAWLGTTRLIDNLAI